tara:strand:- start:115 stop:498 length:384 start_codon:yes stop_codon:yes gene_type:complete
MKGNKMNTPADRANRAAWQHFSLYSIFIMLFIGILANLGTISLIVFAGEKVYLPITILIIFINILSAAGTVDAIGDFDAVRLDYDDKEKETSLAKRFSNTPTLFFKILLTILFIGTGIAQLYVMYLS